MAAMGDAANPPKTKLKADYADVIVVAGCALGAAITLLFLAVMPVNRHLAGARDYVIYWATGQQLAHHGNPYDPERMRALERKRAS